MEITTAGIGFVAGEASIRPSMRPGELRLDLRIVFCVFTLFDCAAFYDRCTPVGRENVIEREQADEAPRVRPMHHRQERRVAHQAQWQRVHLLPL